MFFSLYESRVGAYVNLVPFEYYKMDTITRDDRRARYKNGEGFAGGDFYLGTYFQIIKDRGNVPDVMVTMNIKTASGTGLESARYTDTPAYFFDVSCGKSYESNLNSIDYIRPYCMAGFYVYQTYNDDFYQNDAILHGAGVDIAFKKFIIKNAVGGYKGYIGHGDCPFVYRIDVVSRRDKYVNYEFGFQQGLYDFFYSSFRVAFNFSIME